MKELIKPEIWEWVKKLLEEDWSPEQISGWLNREQRLHISHESEIKKAMDKLNNRSG